MAATVHPVARPGAGYVAAPLVGLVLGALAVIPFVLAGYTFTQWVLAPLGLATADSSNDDGAGVLLVTGVVAPLLLIAAWVLVVRWIVRRCALVPLPAWVLATAGIALPTVLYLLALPA